MNFDLTAEQEAFRKVVREFALEVVAPRSAEADQEEKLPLDVVKQMGDLGLFGLPFPEAYGGSDADAITVCLALEELGRVDQSIAITLSAAVGLAGNLLNRFGTDEQKERWLAPLARGEALGGFGLTEPERGPTRPRSARWRAWRRVSGSSTARRRSSRTRVGRSPPSTSWRRRPSRPEVRAAFRRSSCRPIRRVSRPLPRTASSGGGRATRTSSCSATAGSPVRTCSANADEASRNASRSSPTDGSGGRAVGRPGAGCLDESIKYALQREAFGKPIAAHQAIQFKIADMSAKVETALWPHTGPPG